MTLYFFVLQYLHVIGATVLLGTGAGIAFFMVRAHLSRDVFVIAGVARIVVTADFVFTATAVVVQPVTGYLLARFLGYPLFDGWVALSLVLYGITGAFWIPVVFVQIRMRNLAEAAVRMGTVLPPAYHRLFWAWFACGFPAFAAVLAILWLMTSRPTFSLF
jgi:uncharacterized membrane protein